MRYYQLKQQAIKLQESWLIDLAAAKALDSGGDQIIIYNNLIRQECQKRAGKRLRRVTGKLHAGGLLKVLVQQDNEWVELTKKLAIEDIIYMENIKKFTQTNSTPAIVELLVSDLGYLGNSLAYEYIL